MLGGKDGGREEEGEEGEEEGGEIGKNRKEYWGEWKG